MAACQIAIKQCRSIIELHIRPCFYRVNRFYRLT